MPHEEEKKKITPLVPATVDGIQGPATRSPLPRRSKTVAPRGPVTQRNPARPGSALGNRPVVPGSDITRRQALFAGKAQEHAEKRAALRDRKLKRGAARRGEAVYSGVGVRDEGGFSGRRLPRPGRGAPESVITKGVRQITTQKRLDAEAKAATQQPTGKDARDADIDRFLKSQDPAEVRWAIGVRDDRNKADAAAKSNLTGKKKAQAAAISSQLDRMSKELVALAGKEFETDEAFAKSQERQQEIRTRAAELRKMHDAITGLGGAQPATATGAAAAGGDAEIVGRIDLSKFTAQEQDAIKRIQARIAQEDAAQAAVRPPLQHTELHPGGALEGLQGSRQPLPQAGQVPPAATALPPRTQPGQAPAGQSPLLQRRPQTPAQMNQTRSLVAQRVEDGQPVQGVPPDAELQYKEGTGEYGYLDEASGWWTTGVIDPQTLQFIPVKSFNPQMAQEQDVQFR